MPLEIKTISFGSVNCYLIKTDSGFILIDTGGRDLSKTSLDSMRSVLDTELESAGCLPGNLNLIILTHGHFDHTDNCVYLKNKYNTRIAMHQADLDMVENAILYDRRFRPFYIAILANIYMFFTRTTTKTREVLATFDKFTPNLFVDEGFSLTEYGLDATVIHLPGHSKGSIGILTSDGDLFCGDIIVNAFNKPLINRFMADDNFIELDSSIERLKNLNIKTVYPGHGKPFPMDKLKI